MADKTTGELDAVRESPISGLPGIIDLYDDSLIPVEQQGEARKMTGKQFRQFGEKSADVYVRAAVKAAEQTEKDKVATGIDAERAETAKRAIENMTVSADTLPAGSNATAVKSAAGGSFNIRFGIPRGEQGKEGPQGEQGIQGPPGPQGINGVAVSANGFYAFNVNEEGHLILSYTGDDAPDFSINESGHLILNIA